MGWEQGQVDGQQARIKELQGGGLQAIHNFRGGLPHGHPAQHDEITTRDGLNASYVRENGQVIVNADQPNPYEPYLGK